jgi:hypothetical protein
MPQDHRLQQQRFELKYLIPEEITGSIRDFVRSYLEVDDYGRDQPNFSYPIHSIYLDSDDLYTHRAVVNGTKNRFKLRIRYYNVAPNAPVFLEVKARVNECIIKQRCSVRREAVALVAAGQLPDPSHLLSKEPRHLVALQRFNSLLSRLNARPKLHNSYYREAWVSSNDNSVRVTFDRQIYAEPYFHAKPVVVLERPRQVFPDVVVFEVKFTSRFPNWLGEMIRCFGLTRLASAKYSEGIEIHGEDSFRESPQLWDWHRGDERERLPRKIHEPRMDLAGEFGL